MALVQYEGDYPGVVTGDGVEFPAGVPVDVDEELAKAFVERPDFKRVKPPAK